VTFQAAPALAAATERAGARGSAALPLSGALVGLAAIIGGVSILGQRRAERRRRRIW
jgi:hypothetical protein